MTHRKTFGRRDVIDGILGLAATVPLLALSARAAAADAPACFDPAKLGASAKSLRAALGFVTPAPDPARACGGCAFFVATAKDGQGAGCGTCGLLSGGAVTAKSWCRSWAKKA